MSSAWTESVHVYLDATTARARLRRARWGDAEVRELGEWHWDARDPDSLHMTPNAGLVHRRPLTVYLGTSLLKLATMPAPKGIRGDDERNTIASAALNERFGLRPTEWLASVDATNSRSSSAVVAAVRKGLYQRLTDLAAEQRSTLRSVRPFALEALRFYFDVDSGGTENSARAEAPVRSALAVFEDDALTTLIATSAGYEVASAFPVRSGSLNAVDELKRLRAGHGLLEDDVVQLATVSPSSTQPAARPFGASLRADFLERLVIRS